MREWSVVERGCEVIEICAEGDPLMDVSMYARGEEERGETNGDQKCGESGEDSKSEDKRDDLRR